MRPAPVLPRPDYDAAAQRALALRYRVAAIALDRFLDRGYDQVTVEDIAGAADVSRRTIFREFGGKEDIAFPDHSERREGIARFLAAADPLDDPIEVIIAATEATLHDILTRPELIIKRYELASSTPVIAEREMVEHERYCDLSRAFLRDRLPAGTPHYELIATVALIDAVHRSAATRWARFHGEFDAVGELRKGMAWVRGRLQPSDPSASTEPTLAGSTSSIIAVVPNDERAAPLLRAIAREARRTAAAG